MAGKLRGCEGEFMKDLVIKDSKIHDKGVFANRDFKRGELIIKYNPITISQKDFENMNDQEKESVWPVGKDYFKHSSPAIYVNHSCEPNTNPTEKGDVAIRDIKKGEEITTDYSKDSEGINMKCNCGSKKCKRTIN
jgi:SET domain-containing protein